MRLTWDQIGRVFTPTRFFNTPGNPAAPALRQPGRAFFGAVSEHGQQLDGSVTGGSYLQSLTIDANGTPTTITELDYFEDTARVVAVSNFGIGISGVSRTSGGSGPEVAIGLAGLAINDDGATPALAWGAYIEANRTHLTAGQTIGAEINAAQFPAPSSAGAVGPYGAKGSDWTNALRIAAGSDSVAVHPRSFAVNAAITIANNGGAFWEGIVFDWNSIMRVGGSDDRSVPATTGYGRAISLAHELGISLFSRDSAGVPGDGGQAEVVRIFSTVTDPAHSSSLIFNNAGMVYRERASGGHDIFRAAYRADAAVGLQLEAGSAAGAATVIRAFTESGVPNANIQIVPLGNGTLYMPLANWRDFADDAAAAAASPPVPLGGLYRTGGNPKVRIA